MGLARNSALNLAGAAVPIAVTLVTVPLYLSVIGIERYGVLSIAWLLLGYFGLFDLGLGRAAAQRIAGLAHALPAARNDVFWTALWLNLVLGLVGAAVLVPVGHLAFSAMEGLSGALAEETRAAVPWLAASLPVATLSGLLSGALQGRERFVALNVIGSLGTILGSVSPLLVAVHYGAELRWMIAAALAARLLTSCLLFVSCRRCVPVQPPSLPRWRLVRDLLCFGGWVSVSSVLGPLLASVDRLVIGVMISAAAVTHYVVPFALVSRVQVLPQSLAGALFPLFASRPPGEMDRVKLKALRGLTLLMTPAVLAGLLAVEPFLIVWLGAGLADVSAPVAHILLLGVWMNAAARIAHASLQGSGRPDLVAKAHLGELLPYLGALVPAIQAFGVTGAALVWTMRSAADAAILFLLDGTLKPAFGLLALPAALVACATVTVVSLPLDSAERWLVLAIIDASAVVWWIVNGPTGWRRSWHVPLPKLTP